MPEVEDVFLRFKTFWGACRKYTIFLVVPLLFLAFLIIKVNTKPESALESIDNFILRLKYNSTSLLTLEPAKISHAKIQTSFTNSSFIVETNSKKTVSSKNPDICILAENIHITYPGSILLADSHLIENSPTYVSVKRLPLNYTVDLPSLNEKSNFRIIPEFKNYKSALDQVLNEWYDKLANVSDIPADFSSKYGLAHSREQLKIKFGLGMAFIIDKLNIDFDAIRKKEKLVMIHEFKQKFFDVSIELPHRPSDLFDPSVTSKDLMDRNFGDQFPPVLVDEVSYGRIIYVKLETTSTDDSAKLALSSKFVSGQNYDSMKNLSITLLVLGGGAEHDVELILAKNMEEVNQVITRYSKFNRTNPAHPMAYSTRFIKDNSVALINSVAEYVETTREIHQGGAIRLVHNGLYVAQFQIDWDELGYDEHGTKMMVHRSWYKNGKDLVYKFSETEHFRGNCRNITVKAWACTGIPGDWWRKIFDEENVPLIGYREFSIDGFSFNPYYTIEPTL